MYSSLSLLFFEFFLAESRMSSDIPFIIIDVSLTFSATDSHILMKKNITSFCVNNESPVYCITGSLCCYNYLCTCKFNGPVHYFFRLFWLFDFFDFFDPLNVGQKSLCPLKLSLEMANKVIVSQKQHYVPQFLKQRDINS